MTYIELTLTKFRYFHIALFFIYSSFVNLYSMFIFVQFQPFKKLKWEVF